MVGQRISDKELAELLKLNDIDETYFKSFDENDRIKYISFKVNYILLDKMNKKDTDKVSSDEVVSFLKEKLSFLKDYGYKIEEILYLQHISIPDTFWVSFLKPINNNLDDNVIYRREK
jgi:hypothetical protein